VNFFTPAKKHYAYSFANGILPWSKNVLWKWYHSLWNQEQNSQTK